MNVTEGKSVGKSKGVDVNMSSLRISRYCFALSFILLCAALTITAQTSPFNYQGRLQDGGTPANGTYDFQFRLFDAAVGGNQVGTTIIRDDVPVTSGIFTVSLDFGAATLPGADRFLEIGVRPGSSTGPFTILSPLQPIAATPYAFRSAVTTTADNTNQLGGIAANQYVLTTDSRLSDARTPTPGSTNYIQNRTTQQASAAFNISGNGTAGGTLSGTTVNAQTQYNINGLRVLSLPTNFSNTSVGVLAGTSSTSSLNSFFGSQAGEANVAGFQNSFYGGSAEAANTSGSQNAFFGVGGGS